MQSQANPLYCVISDPKLKELGEDQVNKWKAWFDNRLDNAIEATQHQDLDLNNKDNDNNNNNNKDDFTSKLVCRQL